MKNDEQFDDLLRQKANNHEAPVPADAWDNIMRKKKKRRFTIFWWCLAGVLLAGNIGYLVYQDFCENNPHNVVGQVASTANEHDEDTLPANEENNKENNEWQTEKRVSEKNGATVIDSNDVNANRDKITIGKKKTDEKGIPVKLNYKVKLFDKKNNVPIANKTVAIKERIVDGKQEQQTTTGIAPHIKKAVFLDNDAQASGSDSPVVKNSFLPDKKDDFIGRPDKVVFSEKTISPILQATIGKAVFTSGEKQPATDEQGTAPSKTAGEVAVSSNSITKAGKISKPDTSNTFVNDDSSSDNASLGSRKFIQIKKPGKRTWWIDLSTAPFTSISNSKKIVQLNRSSQMPGYIAEYTADQVKISQQPGVVFAIGVRKNLNKKWAVGAGFAYQQIKEKISLSGAETHVSTTVVQRLDQTANGPVLVNDTIATTTTGVRTINALNSYTLMSVPVFAQYRLAQRKSLFLDINAGGFINLSTKYSNSIAGVFVGQNGVGAKPGADLKVGFDLFAEIRVSKLLAKNIFVFAAPGFRYNLSEYKLKGMLQHTFLHQAGLGVGLSIKL